MGFLMMRQMEASEFRQAEPPRMEDPVGRRISLFASTSRGLQSISGSLPGGRPSCSFPVEVDCRDPYGV